MVKLNNIRVALAMLSTVALVACGQVANETTGNSNETIIRKDSVVNVFIGSTGSDGKGQFDIGILDSEVKLTSSRFSSQSVNETTKIFVTENPNTDVSVSTQIYSIGNGNGNGDDSNAQSVQINELTGERINLPAGLYSVILTKEGYQDLEIKNVPIFRGQGDYLIDQKMIIAFPITINLTPTSNEWIDTGIDINTSQIVKFHIEGSYFSVFNTDTQQMVTATEPNPGNDIQGLALAIKSGNVPSHDFVIVDNQKKGSLDWTKLSTQHFEQGRLYIKIVPLSGSRDINPSGSYNIIFDSQQ